MQIQPLPEFPMLTCHSGTHISGTQQKLLWYKTYGICTIPKWLASLTMRNMNFHSGNLCAHNGFYLPRFHRCQQFGKEYSSDILAFLLLHLERNLGDPQFGSFQILKIFKNNGEFLLLCDQGTVKHSNNEIKILQETNWRSSPKLGTMGAASV